MKQQRQASRKAPAFVDSKAELLRWLEGGCTLKQRRNGSFYLHRIAGSIEVYPRIAAEVLSMRAGWDRWTDEAGRACAALRIPPMQPGEYSSTDESEASDAKA